MYRLFDQVKQGFPYVPTIHRWPALFRSIGGKDTPMIAMKLGPLRLEPIFKRALWGGRRLGPFLRRFPKDEPTPVGEAWVLSDQGDAHSRVAQGPFQGWTLRDLMTMMPDRLLGRSRAVHGRFPVLLKFIDAREALSVQVHPNDEQARCWQSPDANGKTEAWVILNAAADSRIYAGLKPGVTEADFRSALAQNTVADTLHSFVPQTGECVFLRAGTMHAIGQNVLLFEVQQTSDITYRLYDWGRIDPVTSQPRELHIDAGLACTDFTAGPCLPVQPQVEILAQVSKERLVDCEYFSLWRWSGQQTFEVGIAGACRVLVGIEGVAELLVAEEICVVRPGDVWLLPAELGVCECRPAGRVTLLECGLPE